MADKVAKFAKKQIMKMYERIPNLQVSIQKFELKFEAFNFQFKILN